MKVINISIAVLMVFGFISVAHAETQGQFYGGAGIGKSELASSCSPVITNCDDRGKGIKIFGGLVINENFNLEFSYVDLGEFGFSVDVSGVPVTAQIDGNGVSLAGLGLLPLPNSNISLFAKAGLFRWDVTSSASTSGPLLRRVMMELICCTV